MNHRQKEILFALPAPPFQHAHDACPIVQLVLHLLALPIGHLRSFNHAFFICW